MSTRSRLTYLNHSESPLFFSPLRLAIANGQKRAPANQWPNIINSLKSKGVKEAEINDSGILEALEDAIRQDGKKPVTKDDLLQMLDDRALLVKEIHGGAKYRGYSHARFGRDYQERLFVLASRNDFLRDQLIDLDYELDDLDFYPERLIENPLLAQELYEKKLSIQKKLKESSVSSRASLSHYSEIIDPDTNQPIRNLLFHTRTTLQDNGTTFFVDEVQSDWAQRGRRRDWDNVEKGPFVTNTDLWVSLAFKRLMQLAAQDPNIKRFMWITGDQRNGGRYVLNDGLNDFYIKVVGKIVNKLLSGTGVKCGFETIQLGDKEVELPAFEMTDKVREKLIQSQPLYSRDTMLAEASQRAKQRTPEYMGKLLEQAHHLVGSSATIRLLANMTDTMAQPVAGRFFNDVIEVSLAGQNPARAMTHECWHYAYEHLLNSKERTVADTAFLDSGLSERLKEAMAKAGMSQEAIDQCSDPKEAVAHAYSLWANGQFELKSAPDMLQSAFTKTEQAFSSLHEQVQETYGSQTESGLLALFESFAAGDFAEYQSQFYAAAMGG